MARSKRELKKLERGEYTSEWDVDVDMFNILEEKDKEYELPRKKKKQQSTRKASSDVIKTHSRKLTRVAPLSVSGPFPMPLADCVQSLTRAVWQG